MLASFNTNAPSPDKVATGISMAFRKDSSKKPQSEVWGPATINEAGGNAKTSLKASADFESARTKLSAPWQMVLDRLLAKPANTPSVLRKFNDAFNAYGKQLKTTVDASSGSEAAYDTRQRIKAELKKIKQQIDALIASGSKSNTASQIKSLMVQLRQLAQELALNSPNTMSLAAMPSFDGVSVATSAMNSNLDLTSTADNGINDSTTTSSNLSSYINTSNLNSDKTELTDQQKLDLVDAVTMMQSQSQSLTNSKNDLAMHEAKSNEENNKIMNDIRKLLSKGEQIIRAENSRSPKEKQEPSSPSNNKPADLLEIITADLTLSSSSILEL